MRLYLSAAFFLFLVSISEIESFISASKGTSSAAHHQLHLQKTRKVDRQLHHGTSSSSLHVQLQGNHQNPLLTAPLSDHGDPRFGVEERLVPSGPNPLHN
ncbi:CLAVATA3/ESR (CLE)-related protein 9-like [Diospyros lotus]|uniref:CLAVATA3/ESR (CLE)-related protein 9-like n=1 Tax=Diospyros lotus TaxID=55363 RepID=UPI00225443FE|nr:CLAVATA3/ESR (CLE)-related protein 9-like [Diospyros lotus]